jgi:hypothetical protein
MKKEYDRLVNCTTTRYDESNTEWTFNLTFPDLITERSENKDKSNVENKIISSVPDQNNLLKEFGTKLQDPSPAIKKSTALTAFTVFKLKDVQLINGTKPYITNMVVDLIILPENTVLFKGFTTTCEMLGHHNVKDANTDTKVAMSWFGKEKTARVFAKPALGRFHTKRSLLLFDLTNTKNIKALLTHLCDRITLLIRDPKQSSNNGKKIHIKHALYLKMFIGVICATTGYLVNYQEQAEIINMFIEDFVALDEHVNEQFEEHVNEQFEKHNQFIPFVAKDMKFGNLNIHDGFKRFSEVNLDKLLAICIYECVPFVDGYYGMSVPYMFDKFFDSEVCVFNYTFINNNKQKEDESVQYDSCDDICDDSCDNNYTGGSLVENIKEPYFRDFQNYIFSSLELSDVDTDIDRLQTFVNDVKGRLKNTG